jgi:hypothetical protein
MPRRVYHSTVQATMLTIMMGVLLLIAVEAFVIGDVVAKREWFGLVLFPVMGVYSIIGMWLAIRLGVVVDSRGLQLRNFGRGRRIPWAAIDDIDCSACDFRLPFPLYAPIITLTVEQSKQPSSFGLPKPSAKVAEQVPLTALGSYRPATARARTDVLATIFQGSAHESA